MRSARWFLLLVGLAGLGVLAWVIIIDRTPVNLEHEVESYHPIVQGNITDPSIDAADILRHLPCVADVVLGDFQARARAASEIHAGLQRQLADARDLLRGLGDKEGSAIFQRAKAIEGIPFGTCTITG